MSHAAQVAEAIVNDATSGSAVWDELNGPDIQRVDHALLYDEQGGPTDAAVKITIENGGMP